MSDTTDSTATPATAAEATGGGTKEQELFTREQMEEFTNAAIKKRLAQERRKAKRESAPTQEQTPANPTSETHDDLSDVRAQLARLQDDALFGEALMDAGLQLTKAQRKLARKSFDATNVDGWLDDLKEAGIGVTPSPSTPETEPKTPESNAPQYVSPGAPSARPPHEFASSPMEWTRDDIDAMQRDGTFLPKLKEWRNSLPGGRGTLFRPRIPKVT